MRKISRIKGEVLRPTENAAAQPAAVATVKKNVVNVESPEKETQAVRTTGRKMKRKERTPRSEMAKHLDRVLIVSVASLVILAIIYHFEQKNQILERAKGFIEAKMPFLLG